MKGEKGDRGPKVKFYEQFFMKFLLTTTILFLREQMVIQSEEHLGMINHFKNNQPGFIFLLLFRPPGPKGECLMISSSNSSNVRVKIIKTYNYFKIFRLLRKHRLAHAVLTILLLS